MKKELRDFGLTDNEIQVYLALVELRESTATPLRQKTELHTSRIYEALTSLTKKGLVSFYLKNNVKQYVAQNPKVMYDILDDKKEQLIQIMPQITALQSLEQPKDQISMFEGYKAFKQLFNNVLFNLKEGEEILVMGAEDESAHFMHRTFFKEYNQRRINQKVKMRLIFNHSGRDTAKEYAKQKYTKVKILPKGMKIPSGLNIYPDKISMLVAREKPTVFHIECLEVAESYKTYFEFVWQSCKEVK
ncbi:hypothetical protein KY321_03825 [Candidatus Woesearchaeota archaeon]|nr:hypothetical protein [Candidatus Woesearchaeota archaeon]